MAKGGHHVAIENLLSEGAGVNITDRWGRTALQEAITAKQVTRLILKLKICLGFYNQFAYNKSISFDKSLHSALTSIAWPWYEKVSM